MLTGSAMDSADLDRVRLKVCFGAYIIPDVTTADAEAADCQNIMRTLQMVRVHPTLHYKLVLVDPVSTSRAVSLGLQQKNCFALNEFKALMIAQASRVKGFMPLVAGLFKDLDKQAETVPLQKQLEGTSAESDDLRAWLPDYLQGLRWFPRGFVPAEHLVGKPFNEVAADLYEKSDGDILLLAAVSNGLRLNWKGKLLPRQFLIALIPATKTAEDKLNAYADPSLKWQDAFHKTFGKQLVEKMCTNIETAAKRGENAASPTHAGAHARLAADGTLAHYQGFMAFDGEHKMPDEAGSTYDPELQRTRLKTHIVHPSSITFVLPDNNLWVMLDCLLQSLRTPTLLVHQPIIVVSPHRPPVRLLHHFAKDGVTFLVKSEKQDNWMKNTELHKSQKVIVLRNHPERETESGVDVVYSDYKALIQAAVTEQHCVKKESTSFRMYEFLTTDALRIFQQHHADVVSGKVALGAMSGTMTDFGARQEEEGEELEVVAVKTLMGSAITLLTPLLKAVGMLKSFCQGFVVVKNPEVENNPPHRKLCFQWLFASGRAFSAPEIFGITFAATHYMPFGLRLLRALCSGIPVRGDETQTGLLWQVQCPPQWLGKTFGELQVSWLREKDPMFANCDAVLCLAIYRTVLANKTMRGCSIAVPDKSFKLQEGDFITCIGSRDFANVARRANLLHDGDAWNEGETAATPGAAEQIPSPEQTQPSEQTQAYEI